jgi:hypothetical protein
VEGGRATGWDQGEAAGASQEGGQLSLLSIGDRSKGEGCRTGVKLSSLFRQGWIRRNNGWKDQAGIVDVRRKWNTFQNRELRVNPSAS